MKISMKAYGLAAVTLVAAGFLLWPLAGSAQGAGKGKYDGLVIRWATQPSQTQAAIAEELGFFREEFEKDGITVDLRTFASGPPIIEAFAAGALDFGQVGNQPAIQAIANGIDIKILGAYMASDGSATGLLAKNGAGIKTLADLKGKKIGFTVGSEAHHVLLRFLQAARLSEDEVELVNLPIGDIGTSLASGNVDAAITWQPYLAGILEGGYAYLVQTAAGYMNAPSVIIGKREFLEKYPEVVVRLFKVLNRSYLWSKEHEAESIKLLSKRTGVAEKSYKASFDTLSFSLYLSEKQIEFLGGTEAFLLKQGTIRRAIDIRKHIDTSFITKAGVSRE
jgi:sulfonate transport system substrate-binding protein